MILLRGREEGSLSLSEPNFAGRDGMILYKSKAVLLFVKGGWSSYRGKAISEGSNQTQ